ncbi:MAG: ubiquinol-cytochrome c chaperone [Alphaproteobacteria bacterium]|jgi:cytochrome b pre-mRNA-processing protein 3|nr:ubiquinol-cytochrome c chaperone [Alphaproteobacteria bacterium]
MPLSLLKSLLRRDPHRPLAARLYSALAPQARHPEFYGPRYGVPDTLEGRFDLLILHAFLVMERLQAEANGPAINQALFDEMFRHLDLTLREIGVQDLGVGRRIKAMAEAFNGRTTAYRAALAGEGEPLALAIRRNVHGDNPAASEGADRLAIYCMSVLAGFRGQSTHSILAGRLGFPDPATI